MNNMEARILISTLMLKMPSPLVDTVELSKFVQARERNSLSQLAGDLLFGADPTVRQSDYLSDVYRKYVSSVPNLGIEVTKRHAETLICRSFKVVQRSSEKPELEARSGSLSEELQEIDRLRSMLLNTTDVREKNRLRIKIRNAQARIRRAKKARQSKPKPHPPVVSGGSFA